MIFSIFFSFPLFGIFSWSVPLLLFQRVLTPLLPLMAVYPVLFWLWEGKLGQRPMYLHMGNFLLLHLGLKEVSSSRSVGLNVKGVAGLAVPLTNLLKQIYY